MTMTVSAESRDLRAALAKLKILVDTNLTVLTLGWVRLGVIGDKLRLEATDLDTWLTLFIPCEVHEGQGEPTTMCVSLQSFIAAIPTESARVELKADRALATLSVSSRRTHTSLPTLPALDFPVFRQPENEDADRFYVGLRASEASDMLRAVAPAISTDKTRYYLRGVNLDVDAGGFITFAATDGRRLSSWRLNLRGAERKTSGGIIPHAAVKVWAKCAGDASMYMWKTKARIAGVDWKIETKLIDGDFPDYRRVIPPLNKSANTYTVPRGWLLSALKNARPTKKDAGFKFTFGPDILDIERLSVDGGRFKAQVPCDGVGKETSVVGLNALYLKAAAEAFASSVEHITLQITASDAPVRIWADTQPELLLVIMPIQT